MAPGTAILSLTEPDLTVTLDASASNRTQLTVGQSCTVQIDGENNSVVGHDHRARLHADRRSPPPPPGKDRSRSTKGKIEASRARTAPTARPSPSMWSTQQEVERADGAHRRGEAERNGPDVVRVVQVSQGDRVIEVPVTTGLTEGSYIEITKGLRAGADSHRRGRPAVVTATASPTRRPSSGVDTPDRPLLELDHVSRMYGEEVVVYALRDVSLRIMAGEFIVDRGALGIGKVDHARPAGRARSAHGRHRPRRPVTTSARSTTRPARGYAATRSGSSSNSSTSSPT